MTDSSSYITMALKANPIREPMLREAIEALKLAPGSQGLDAGCGIGLQSLLLAAAVGPNGHVTGLDTSKEFLRYAQNIVESSPLSERITYKEGDAGSLPFDDKTFDWVWSVDCVGYPTEEHPLSKLKELARVVKPGGIVAILGWSSQMLLPGHPLLEAKLNATCSSYLPYIKEKRPKTNFLNALGWFRELGLEDSRSRTFVNEIYAPLDDEMRTALISFFEMLWGDPQPEVSEEDWAEYQRLCSPDSQDFILDRPDYYAFYTYSMFQGKIPE
jgi:demethylmenaquinone methyltransferase/2-methoxy-6-polyprenyl-1,4-benzoquinol methylase